MSIDGQNAQLLLEDETLRDGLQLESRIFSLDEKLELFEMLKNAGIKRIQVGSFVNPKVVPQMADTDELIRSIGSEGNHLTSALVLNEAGLQRALECGVSHVSLSVSVSDTHSRKNARRPAAEALAEMTRLIRAASAGGLDSRAGLQCVFGCVYEGQIAESKVVSAAREMIDAGATEINLADTTGMATPYSIRSVIRRLRQEFPHMLISLHLHDTRGLGLTNLFAGYEEGVRSFDVCAGGLGGCPFVKGAAGNVPTEDAVHMFEAMGIQTGIDIEAVCAVVGFLERKLGRQLPGRMKRVLKHGTVCE